MAGDNHEERNLKDGVDALKERKKMMVCAVTLG
jgi:hypothetical protein